MTEWCDTCKIFVSSNPASIRNHELGQKHKDNVAQRLNTMREEKAAKEKEQKKTAKVLEQIEAKAKRSYEKDLAVFQEARESNAPGPGDVSTMPGDWEYESSSGYYYNQTTGYYYDPSSNFYYTDAQGKWVTQEEAIAAFQSSSGKIQKKPLLGKRLSASENRSSTSGSGPPPGHVVTTPLNPMRSTKSAPSSVAVKRKKPDLKPKVMSKEEKEALKAREAARKRVETREKPLLGHYKRNLTATSAAVHHVIADKADGLLYSGACAHAWILWFALHISPLHPAKSSHNIDIERVY